MCCEKNDDHDIQADLGPSLWNGSTCGEKMEMYCSAWDLFRNTPSCKQAIGNSQKLTSLKQNKMHIHTLHVITKGLHSTQWNIWNPANLDKDLINCNKYFTPLPHSLRWFQWSWDQTELVLWCTLGSKDQLLIYIPYKYTCFQSRCHSKLVETPPVD